MSSYVELWTIGLVLLATAQFAASNVIDKIIVSRLTSNAYIPALVAGVVGYLAAEIVHLAGKVAAVPIWFIVLAVVSGVLFSGLVTCYFQAISLEEASKIVPIFYVNQVWTAFLAAVFLEEIFTTKTYLAIVLIVGSAIYLSEPRGLTSPSRRALAWTLAGTLAVAAHLVLMKYLLQSTEQVLGQMEFWTTSYYVRIGTLLGLLPIFLHHGGELWQLVRTGQWRALTPIVASESNCVVAIFLITVATTYAPVTLVQALGATQPVFLLVFTLLLSRFWPKVHREEITTNLLIRRIVAISLITVDAFILPPSSVPEQAHTPVV